MFEKRRRHLAPALMAFLVAIAGCSENSALGPSNTGQFSREIGLEEFSETVSLEASRVEIRLIPGTLTAREVEIEEPEDRLDQEELESPVTAMTADGDAGTLTLAMGNLQVSFDRSTRFEAEDEGDLSFEEFVGRLQTMLGAGALPVVEAKRPPASPPQAPDDATFFATRLEIEGESDNDQKIEINIDGANLSANSSPPPDARLQVLGLMIELRVSEGVTRLKAEDEDAPEDFEFEGLVEFVDLNAQTFTFANGSTVRIVATTEIERDSSDDDQLESLAEVAAALDMGLKVEAEVEGTIETSEPLMIVATEVEFELEDDDSGDDNTGQG